jgi:hypothetical protein
MSRRRQQDEWGFAAPTTGMELFAVIVRESMARANAGLSQEIATPRCGNSRKQDSASLSEAFEIRGRVAMGSASARKKKTVGR